MYSIPETLGRIDPFIILVVVGDVVVSVVVNIIVLSTSNAFFSGVVSISPVCPLLRQLTACVYLDHRSLSDQRASCPQETQLPATSGQSHPTNHIRPIASSQLFCCGTATCAEGKSEGDQLTRVKRANPPIQGEDNGPSD